MQMKGRSTASKTKQGKDSTMSIPTNAVQLELPLFATAELVQPNSETSSPANLNLCDSSIQTPKSSKILAEELTSKGKDCKPYWSDLCAANSSRLLLPVVTDCAGSDLNCSSLWQNKTVEKSWFSTELFTAQKPNSQAIFLPSFTSSVAECTDSEATARKSRNIRLFLNAEQKSLIKQ
jgi:putative transposase